MKKICVVLTSRAQYGRLKSVLTKIRDHPNLELQLVVGASALLDKYSCMQAVTKDGFEIADKLYCIVDGDTPGTMAQSTGLLTQQLTTVFDRLQPDTVLVHADRFEQLAVAIAASYMNIKLAHNQGGEVTGSIDDRVRHAITQLADIHFTATDLARDRVISMGHSPASVFNVGCPAIDLIPQDLEIHEDFCVKYGGVGPNINLTAPYLVVMQHPVTTEYGEGKQQIQQTLEAIKLLKIPTVWLWPNVDAGNDDISGELRRFREQEKPDYIHFFKNLSPEDFYKLIYNCACLVGNTSSGLREGSYLGIPYVCIGSRQDEREKGNNVIFVDHNENMIYRAILYQVRHGKYSTDTLYGSGNASQRIVEILEDL